MAKRTDPRTELSAEARRLAEDARRERNWKRWGPYLSERQWSTVREDYSEWGSCWDYFPHDHARSRTYRWGEDGLLGIADRECRVCFAIALWNENDPILKERLFGLTGPEGNHGEDVKECYYYLDSTPTHSYMKALYKYPQRAFPYAQLVEGNRARARGKGERELELTDTDAFDEDRYFDVFAEYAKGDPDDVLIRITVANRGPEAARLHVLPTVWLRNTWTWGRATDGYWPKGNIAVIDATTVRIDHRSLGSLRLAAEPGNDAPPELLFTDNETNSAKLFGVADGPRYAKDAFHDYVVDARRDAVRADGQGTKTAFYYRITVPAGGETILRLRLSAESAAPKRAFGADYERIFRDRLAEANAFYAERTPPNATDEERRVLRQGHAGLLWSKQYFHYIVDHWLEGDPTQPPPPSSRLEGRNHEWRHLFNRDIISMCDKWEYPWYAAWDLAFHMIPFARIDPQFAKDQLVLFLREWYMHPNGQIPAYEFAFSDVNPPVHAWSAWRVYKISDKRGARDRVFLARVFQKLLLNFTWWVNRKDAEGHNLFSGGFLGMDNIGVFDRSQQLPTGGHLEQADGTAWMAFYCATMLSMALELAKEDPAYEDMASKFFEHFVAISDAMNTLGGSGLWDDLDGFYYDQLHADGHHVPLRIRSLVGLMPLIAVEVLEQKAIDQLPGFKKRLDWFLENRQDLAGHISYCTASSRNQNGHRLLAIPSRERLERVLRYMLDETEFLSPYGIRSVSRVHAAHPYVFHVGAQDHRVAYVPGESETGLFGGNSNWRGPVWFPINYLLVEALERYHHFYGDGFRIECPTGSGRLMDLQQVAIEIAGRLSRIFLPNAQGARPCHGGDERYANDLHWRDLVLFYEYFHGEDGRGLGASHQTGWTALVLGLIQDLARQRVATAEGGAHASGRLAAAVVHADHEHGSELSQ